VNYENLCILAIMPLEYFYYKIGPYKHILDELVVLYSHPKVLKFTIWLPILVLHITASHGALSFVL
jgi:hypothetical protein